MLIRGFNDFVDAVHTCGFSVGGGKGNGIFSIISWDWNETPPYETPVRWHTGDPETDPWEWRMRVLEERNDIAYAKVFFKRSGFISKEWYPYFLAARRGGMRFEDEYADGHISSFSKKVYGIIKENGALPVHVIKTFGGFGKEDRSRFERSITELQMKLYITMCGRQQKISNMGMEYGWSSNVFCTTEQFWGDEVFEKANNLEEEDAIEKISAQVLRLNPTADPGNIRKFIEGKA